MRWSGRHVVPDLDDRRRLLRLPRLVRADPLEPGRGAVRLAHRGEAVQHREPGGDVGMDHRAPVCSERISAC